MSRAILQVQDALKVDLGDVVVVEETVRGGGDGQEDGRGGQEENGTEVCLDRRGGGEDSKRCQG